MTPAPKSTEEIARQAEVEQVARAICGVRNDNPDEVLGVALSRGKTIKRWQMHTGEACAALGAIAETRRAEVQEARAAVWREAIEIMRCEPTIRQALRAIERRAAEDAGGPTP